MYFPDITEEHGSQLSFVYDGWSRGLVSWTYSKVHLDSLREQIDAHYQGCVSDRVTASELTWDLDTAGAVFATAAVALGTEQTLSDALLEAIQARPENLEAAAAAVCIQTTKKARETCRRWLQGSDLVLKSIAVVAGSQFALVNSEMLETALRSHESVLQWAAILSTISDSDFDPVAEFVPLLDSSDANTRYLAAVSLGQLGNQPGIQALKAHLSNRDHRWPALRILGAKLPEDECRQLARKLAGDAETLPMAVRLAGYAGMTNAIPRLLEFMKEPNMAHFAAEAIGFITGVDYMQENLVPADATPDQARSSDDEGIVLPEPDAAAFEKWWEANELGFASSQPLIMGRPRDTGWMDQVIQNTNQHVHTFTTLLQGAVPKSTLEQFLR